VLLAVAAIAQSCQRSALAGQVHVAVDGIIYPHVTADASAACRIARSSEFRVLWRDRVE
jgi:hypothetical protein